MGSLRGLAEVAGPRLTAGFLVTVSWLITGCFGLVTWGCLTLRLADGCSVVSGAILGAFQALRYKVMNSCNKSHL